MNQWKSLRLEDLPISFIDGDRSKRYPKRSEFVDQGILFLNAASIKSGFLNIQAANFISEEKFNSIKKGRLQQGDVVLTMRGNGVGQVGFFNNGPKTGLINAQMLIIRADNAKIDSRFLFYVFRSPYYFACLRLLATGSAQPQLSITSLKKLEVSVPEYAEQLKISAILAAYDDLIENNLHRIKILEEMAQNLYREWFVKLRFPGHENVRMVDSEVGKLPKGWEVLPLSELANTLYGFAFKSKQFNTEGRGVPVVRIRDIPNGISPTYTDESADDKYLINDGDVRRQLSCPVRRQLS